MGRIRKLLPASSLIALGIASATFWQKDQPTPSKSIVATPTSESSAPPFEWNLDRQPVISLHLKVPPPVFDFSSGTFGDRSLVETARPRSLSQLKLFDTGGLIAEWKYGSPIEYGFPGLKPFGGNFGGRVSTNSAKLTLSWKTDN